MTDNPPPPASAAASGASSASGAATEEMNYRSKLANLSNTAAATGSNGTSHNMHDAMIPTTTKASASGGVGRPTGTGGRSRGGRKSTGTARRATFDPSTAGGTVMRTPAAKGAAAVRGVASDFRPGARDASSLTLATPSAKAAGGAAAAAGGGRKSISRAQTMSSYYGGGEAAQAVLRSAVKSHKKSARKPTRPIVAAATASAAADDSFVTAVGDTTVDHTYESQEGGQDGTANLDDIADLADIDLVATAASGNAAAGSSADAADSSHLLNSTTSSSDDDLMNRSAMSDPHDLTASSFLLDNKSRAMLRESTRELTQREAAAAAAAAAQAQAQVQAQVNAQAPSAQHQDTDDDDETGMGWEDKADQGIFTEELDGSLFANVHKMQQQQQQESLDDTKVDGTVILDDGETAFTDTTSRMPEAAGAATAAEAQNNDVVDDDTREDWEMREDDHQHTLDINNALKLVQQQQPSAKDGNDGNDETSKLDGSIMVGSGRGRSSIGGGRTVSLMAAASPSSVRAPNGVIIPSPSLVATPPIRSATTPGASPGSAASASSARRFAGSLRKTKHLANTDSSAQGNSARRASAPLPAVRLPNGAGGDRRKSVAVLPTGRSASSTADTAASAKSRAFIGGGVPLAPVAASVARLNQVLNGTSDVGEDEVANTDTSNSKANDDITAHSGMISDLLEKSVDDDDIMQQKEKTVATSSQEQRRKSSIGGGSVNALHPFTLDASMESNAPPSVGGRRSSSGSFAEMERMAQEAAAMEADDIGGEELSSPSAASVRSIVKSPSSLKTRRLSAKTATPPMRVLHSENDEEDDDNQTMEEEMTESVEVETHSSPAPASSAKKAHSTAAPHFADSPARNTRGASKRKSISSPGVGSLGSFLPPGTPESDSKPSDKKRRSSSSQGATDLPPRSPKLAIDSPARNTRSASKRKTLSPAPEEEEASASPVAAAGGTDDEQDSIDVSDDTANTFDLKNIFDGVAVPSPAKESSKNDDGYGEEEEVATTAHAKRSSKRRKSRSSSDNDVTTSSSESTMGQGDTINLAEFVALSQELSQKDKSPGGDEGLDSTTAGAKVTFSAATPKAIGNNEDTSNASDDNNDTPPLRRSVSDRSATPGLARASGQSDEEESLVLHGKENDEEKRQEEEEEEKEDEEVITTQDTNLVASPPPARPSMATKASAPPRSILNSSRKPRDSIASMGSRRQSGARRSVAFGSPEAAEYNVGSPSMSMTPMPSKQAKKMYVVPENINQDASMSSSNESEPSIELGNDTADLNDINGVLDGSQTMELEQDVNTMLKRTENEVNEESIDRGGDSPAASATAELPADIHGLLADAEQQYQTELAGALSPADSSIATPGANNEANTVELAGDVNALLAQNLGSGAETPVTSPTDSIEMTDAQSLASMNSRPRPSNSPTEEDGDNSATQSFQSKKLLFDSKIHHAPSGLSSDEEGGIIADDEDRTQELDANLRTLLDNAGGKSPASGSAAAATAASCCGPDSRFSSNFVPRTNRMSFGSVATAEATQTIELEVNMDALIEQIGPDDSDETEGDDALNPETQELEGDMSALLAGVANTSTLSVGRKESSSSRRKSRLSLVPQGRISLSTNGNEVFETVSAEEDIDVPGAGTEEAEPTAKSFEAEAETEVEPENVDVTFDELASSAQLLSRHHPEEMDPGFNVLLDCLSLSANTRSNAMVDTVNQFLSAVCDSVEGNVEATRFDGAEIDHIIATKMDEMRLIQRGVRSVGPNAERTVELLQSLARSVEEFALADWLSWETQVAEALKQSVEPVSADTETDMDQICAKVRLADDIHESMANMADRRVRKARRRSMCRRKNAVSNMEDELRDIELQIEEAEAEFEEQQKAKEMLVLMSDALRAESSAKSEMQLQKQTAEESRGKINSVEKLHIWSPLCMEDSEISVSFNEFVKDPSMVVKFVNLQQRPIKCVPSLVSEQDNRIVLKSVGSYKYSPSVAAFVKARMQRLVDEVAARNGGNLTVSGMKTILQTLEWQIGRLELLAKEVQRMISHHEGVLYRNNSGDEAFGIRFDMGGKLRVKILLNNSFAHGPIDLTLDQVEEDVDVSRIRRQLLKNSKSGFGSMSRAIDIIAAALR